MEFLENTLYGVDDDDDDSSLNRVDIDFNNLDDRSVRLQLSRSS